jgi:hypothetical protein
MNTKTLLPVLSNLIKNQLQFLLVGAPAIGKTETVKQACKDAGNELIIMHPVVSDPTDFKGIGAIVNDVAEFLPTGELRKLMNADEPTLCFIDDLGQASPAVQASLMQLILAREINGKKISDQVTFAGATNRRRDKAGVKGVLQPLLSRFRTILEVEVDLDGWVSWALRNDMPAELIAFIRFRSDLLHKFDPDAVSSTGESLINQPSPRTWESVGLLTKAGITDYEVIAGAVGEAGATEYCGFLAMIKKLGNLPSQILAGEMPDCPADPSTLFALSACLAKYSASQFAIVARWIGEKMPLEFAGRFLVDAEAKNPDISAQKEFADLSLKVNGFISC